MAPISDIFSVMKLHDEPHPSHHHFNFLGLPGELRNQIYRLTLTTDPPRLYRQHKHSCIWCTRDPDGPQNRMVDDLGRTLPGCRCWARRGLALLLANRKIHEEAAPIFWAENHFSFEGFKSFIRLVGGSLRPQYRQMIPHVTIYLDPGRKYDGVQRMDTPMYLHMDFPPARFWDVLFECKGLRTLEIPPYRRGCPWSSTNQRLVDAELASWDRLTSELPNLMTFSWSYFARGHDRMQMPFRHIGAFEYPRRTTKRIDLTVWSPDQFRRYGPFTGEDFGFTEYLCSVDTPNGPRGPLPGKFPVSQATMDNYLRLNGVFGHKPFEETHPAGMPMDWTVELFFLPLSPETIAQNSMLRARDKNSKDAEKDASSS